MQAPHRLPRLVAVGLWLAVSSLACSPARFPKELFTVHGQGADYPVMVSRAPSDGRGRSVQAQSGTHFAQSSQTYSSGNASVTVTTTEASRSELPAIDKVFVQVRRNDKALFIEHVEFYADDFSTYGSSSADRNLTIQAKVTQ